MDFAPKAKGYIRKTALTKVDKRAVNRGRQVRSLTKSLFGEGIKTRYFALRGQQLSYFDHTRQMKEKQIIDIASARIDELNEDDEERKYGLKLITGSGEEMDIFFDCVENRQLWAEVIRYASNMSEWNPENYNKFKFVTPSPVVNPWPGIPSQFLTIHNDSHLDDVIVILASAENKSSTFNIHSDGLLYNPNKREIVAKNKYLRKTIVHGDYFTFRAKKSNQLQVFKAVYNEVDRMVKNYIRFPSVTVPEGCTYHITAAYLSNPASMEGPDYLTVNFTDS